MEDKQPLAVLATIGRWDEGRVLQDQFTALRDD